MSDLDHMLDVVTRVNELPGVHLQFTKAERVYALTRPP